jgi:hypothetical protein
MKGLAGQDGEPGKDGERGERGPIGGQGPRGFPGEQGPVGRRGEKGDKGLQGIQGVQGLKGDKGDQGIQGPVGKDGLAGLQGAAGPPGPKGDKGDRGPVPDHEIDMKKGRIRFMRPDGKFGAWLEIKQEIIDQTVRVGASGGRGEQMTQALKDIEALQAADDALGTMSTQDADEIDITGGTMDAVDITGGTAIGIVTTTREVTDATDTLVLADNGKTIDCNRATAQTITIPASADVAFPVGTEILIVQVGAGTVTIKGDTGVTVNGASGGSGDLENQFAAVVLRKAATNTWYIYTGGIGTIS